MSLNSISEDFVPFSRIKSAAILQTVPLLTIKMVRFLGLASLLLFSYSAIVAAGTTPRVPIADTDDVGAGLLGRACCEPYDIQLNRLFYSPCVQRSAMMAVRAAIQGPSVAAAGLAVHVRAYFNGRSLVDLLTTGLIQAVHRGRDARTRTVEARAITPESK